MSSKEGSCWEASRDSFWLLSWQRLKVTGFVELHVWWPKGHKKHTLNKTLILLLNCRSICIYSEPILILKLFPPCIKQLCWTYTVFGFLATLFQFSWTSSQWLTRPSSHPSLTDQSIVIVVLQGELAPAYLFLGGRLSFRNHSLGTTTLLHALLIPPCYPSGQGKEFAAVVFL